MGIRKKIMLGFFLLAILLFFSGMMSFFELERLSRSTENVIEMRLRNMELSNTMLNALQEQNLILSQILISGDEQNHKADLIAARNKFDDALRSAATIVRELPMVDSIYYSNAHYTSVVDSRLALTDVRGDDIVDWYSSAYKRSYTGLRGLIITFLQATQHMVDTNATQLESNAYRAITPGIITLGIAIMVILMFFYFIDVYFIHPVTKLTSGLNKFLNYKVPFNVTVEGRDEVLSLREYIEELISRLKAKENE